MVNRIEKLLFEKTETKRSHILSSQWGIAKEYVFEVLSTISHVFPHYSLHDRTHSESIINNIIRIMGEDMLEKMTATDLWLLLCSAYYHDLGMAVTAVDKGKIITNEGFVNFIKDIQQDSTSSLYIHANYFEIKENQIFYKNNELKADNYDSSRFLLAEFIRRQHSERSDNNVVNNITMKLPGSPIPSRLINLLGKICHVHTADFETVMTLPYSEAGIDYEDCHPRFIACLLRLGDLLDMDNNRFSDVLLNSISSIPVDSILHNEKHLSISHLRIDRKLIEATAVCDKYEVADLANHWFSMINQELTDQMKRWHDIVPDSSYGYLPTIGSLNVELEGYETIDGKNRPQFQIDPQKSIELLQGSGIYSAPYQSIRELLQNAVDATLFRIFIENETDGRKLDLDSFKDECNKFPIDIEIKQGIHDKDNTKKIWHIKIRDNGFGMSRMDLKYLCNTGSSSKNIEKRRIKERMPEWLKPSGTFGIGFQSVFLLTEQVKIKTRKYDKEEILDITLNNPSGTNQGSILIKTVNDRFKYGTELSFDLVVDKIPSSWSVDTSNELAMSSIYNYDFVNDESMDISIYQIIYEICKFNHISSLDIKINFEGNDISIDKEKCNEKNNYYYSERTGFEIKLLDPQKANQFYYRNQLIQNHEYWFRFLNYSVNILNGDAKNILNLDRNKFQNNYKSKLKNQIFETIIDYLNSNAVFPEIIQQNVSMFIEFYKHKINDNDLKKLEKKFKNKWHEYKIEIEGNQVNIKTILDTYSIFKLKKSQEQYNHNMFYVNENTLTMLPKYNDDYANFLFYIFLSEKRNWYYDAENNNIHYIIISDQENDYYIKNWEGWKAIFLNSRTKRLLLPCSKKYKELALKTDHKIDKALEELKFFFRIPDVACFKSPQMISPYILLNPHEYGASAIDGKRLAEDINENLIKLVYDNRADSTVQKEDIICKYKEFISNVKLTLD